MTSMVKLLLHTHSLSSAVSGLKNKQAHLGKHFLTSYNSSAQRLMYDFSLESRSYYQTFFTTFSATVLLILFSLQDKKYVMLSAALRHRMAL